MGDSQGTQTQRSDQQTGHQIAGDIGQIVTGSQTGQKKAGKHSQTDGKQVFHIECLFSNYFFCRAIIPFRVWDARACISQDFYLFHKANCLFLWKMTKYNLFPSCRFRQERPFPLQTGHNGAIIT